MTITDTLNDLRSPGLLVGESVGMRGDYLRPRLDLLRGRLEPGERILARGRAFEPYRDSFELSQLIGGPGCAVVVTDSFGRAWRQGQCEVAIGCAGLAPAEVWRGRPDAEGREMRASVIAIADEVAAAADLVRAKTSREPAVRVRGLERHVIAEDGPGAAALVRAWESDLFR